MTEEQKMDLLSNFVNDDDARLLVARLLMMAEEETISPENATKLWDRLEDFNEPGVTQ